MSETAADARMEVRFDGSAREVFGIAFRRMLLTIATLGLHRFWMRAALRRWYWANTKLGGEGFIYTGTGLEMFLGFLLAMVVLAVALGLGQVIATFAGFGFGHPVASNIATLLILPLIPFALYRARRYILSRTSWNGVRFGMEPGAWGYVWRWLNWGFVSAISLGLLAPLATLRLETYLTARTRYGDLGFVQEGRWQELWRKWIWYWLGAVALLAVSGGVIFGGIAAIALSAPPTDGAFDPISIIPFAPFAGILIVAPLLALLLTAWQVRAFCWLTSRKRSDNGALLFADLKARRVVWVYLRFILIGLAAYLAFGALLFGAFAALGGMAALDGAAGPEAAFAALPGAVFLVGALLFLLFIAVMAAITEAALALPLARLHLEAAHVEQADKLLSARQRAREDAAAADGFADALDVDLGAAF